MGRQAKQLSPDDWFNAGLELLEKHGSPALKAEAIAREIGATKGSFYWHFKNVSDFNTRLLEHWKVNINTAHSTDKTLSPVERLLSLATLEAPKRKYAIYYRAESSIRAWALTEDRARQTISTVDQSRLGELQHILVELGIANPDFSRAIYATIIGLSALPAGTKTQNESTLTSLLAAITALADS